MIWSHVTNFKIFIELIIWKKSLFKLKIINQLKNVMSPTGHKGRTKVKTKRKRIWSSRWPWKSPKHKSNGWETVQLNSSKPFAETRSRRPPPPRHHPPISLEPKTQPWLPRRVPLNQPWLPLPKTNNYSRVNNICLLNCLSFLK